MNEQTSLTPSGITEKETTVSSGWLMLPVTLFLFFGSIVTFILSIAMGVRDHGQPIWWLFCASILVFITTIFLFCGFFSLEPNQARVLVLFGEYKGTVRKSGYYWGNPFYSNGGSGSSMAIAQMKASGTDSEKMAAAAAERILKRNRRNKISLRARNHNGEKLKVNDKRGNPVEIAAVVVWRVTDTAQAMFDVDNYEHYVSVQSEAAVRQIASHYAYDNGDEDEITLRGDMEEVANDLKRELDERLLKAGVKVEEARLTHLAYAPEIAQAMLRRQQAEAVIAARQKIVHGAVGMVQMALTELADKEVVDFDDERRAAMVSNLLVVLCGESEVHPVVNAGSLYN
jgi:regulator of protease activity HflC (stomatin/prohibitin superfamily)